jgi:hypothetical protein
MELTTDEDVIREMVSNVPSYRNIQPTLETRLMSERRLTLENFECFIGDRFLGALLKPEDLDLIEKTAKAYREGFPELFGGVYEDVLFPARYAQLMEEMKIIALVDTVTGNVASSWILTPSERNMSVEFSLTVTNPGYRGKGLCKDFTNRVEHWVGLSTVEQGIVYCAAFHEVTQNIFRDLGFERQAFLKGFILANLGGSEYARDNVVMMTKFYGSSENLSPNV